MTSAEAVAAGPIRQGQLLAEGALTSRQLTEATLEAIEKPLRIGVSYSAAAATKAPTIGTYDLPLAVQLIARRGDDARLMSLAGQLERSRA